ncbi:MAG: GH25 family lysozyme [Coriobacteriales bacterium]|nr:GH25 family lysozyme [Coriobacteriales bacterium]
MATVRKQIVRILFCTLLTLGVISTVALADDNTEGFGVNSFRYQDGERAATEYVEGTDEDELSAQAQFVMWTRNSKGNYVSSNGKEIPGALRRGIDVSEWNGTIDWAKVKNDDVSFAIIRCGGTFMTSRKQYGDDEFLRNCQECERLGIPYGVYFFSTAKNVSDAKKEAAFTLNCLKGLKPTMPIYYDLEWEDLASTSNRKMFADISTTFCEAIAAAGYTPGVYASTSWWENYLTDPCFNRWTKWVAQYYSRCEYEGDYDIWQCTSVATIKGISGSNNVDLNFDFRGTWGPGGEWVKSGSTWKYKYEDGTYASGNFVNIDGAVYCFDSNNNALKGWHKINGKYYYFDATTRIMQRGWMQLDGVWYWMNSGTGEMATGWTEVDDVWYYFDPTNGAMKQSTIFEVNGKKYLANESGACLEDSWVKLNGKWYLTNSSCALRSGWVTIGNVKYYLDPKTYAMKASESFKVDGQTYTANASGVVGYLTGWVQADDGRWWYSNGDGTYLKNTFKTFGKTKYYFDGSGWMATGWKKINGKWYWFSDSGAMATNRWISGTYYVGSDGAMLTSTTTPDGYKVGADGAWLGNEGWRKSGDRWWYSYGDGTWVANQFKKIGKATYWFDKSGWMATGWKKINGKWYWFSDSGAMATNRWISGTYYVGSDGAMLTSTTTPDGYKVGADGAWIR